MSQPSQAREHEDRARAIKAYKIARVLRVADTPTESWREATPAVRRRAADVAGTRVPSERTWQMAVDLLGHMRHEH